jgi:hypothetical protein
MSGLNAILLGTGRGTARSVVEGGSRPRARSAGHDSPLRQPLRGCHLPASGEDLR